MWLGGLLAGLLGLALGGLGVHHGLELRASHELGHRGCGDLQCRARGGVLAGACGALGGLERAEADKLHRLALLHGSLDGLDQRLEHGIGRRLGEIVL